MALFATWIVWGSTYLAIKLALPGMPAFFQMGSRFVVAGTLLLLMERVRGSRMPLLKEWRSAAVVGTLLLGVGAGGTALAEGTIASGLAAAFVAFEPVLIVLMKLVAKQHPARTEIVGITLGVLGVTLLVSGTGFSASPAGLAAMSAATLSWSAGSVLATSRLRAAPGAAGPASQMICGGAVLLIAAFAIRERLPEWPIPSISIAAWLYLIVFGSMVAYTAFAYLLTHARTSIAMSYTFVNPLVALLLGASFGDEHFALSEIFATIIIAASIVFLFPSSRSTSTGTD